MRYAVALGVLVWAFGLAAALSLVLLAVPVVWVPVCLARQLGRLKGRGV